MRRIFTAVLAAGLLTALSSVAATTDTKSIKTSLANVPVPELPAKAADLIKATKTSDRAAVTVDVVKTLVSKNPTIATSLVGAIGKTSPDMVALAAATAAKEQPKLAAAIARAASAAAPSKAGEIVAAVCQVVPADYRKIALAAEQAAPGSAREILRSIALAMPSLKPAIDSALASNSAQAPQVAAVLGTSTQPSTINGVSAPSIVRGPTVAPPYVPASGSAGTIRPTDTDPVPRGGRDYAAP